MGMSRSWERYDAARKNDLINTLRKLAAIPSGISADVVPLEVWGRQGAGFAPITPYESAPAEVVSVMKRDLVKAMSDAELMRELQRRGVLPNAAAATPAPQDAKPKPARTDVGDAILRLRAHGDTLRWIDR